MMRSNLGLLLLFVSCEINPAALPIAGHYVVSRLEGASPGLRVEGVLDIFDDGQFQLWISVISAAPESAPIPVTFDTDGWPLRFLGTWLPSEETGVRLLARSAHGQNQEAPLELPVWMHDGVIRYQGPCLAVHFQKQR